MIILMAIIVLLELISYIVIFDVILSWLVLLGIRFRPKFIADIINPLYKSVKKILPTAFWPLDFTPIIVIILLIFLKWVIFILFPEVQVEFSKLIK